MLFDNLQDKTMEYEFFGGGVDSSCCNIDCKGLSDEQVWQLVLKFFGNLDPPGNSYLWARYRQDILRSNVPQSLLCEGCLDIYLENTRVSRKLKIFTHGNRCDQKILDRFKLAVEQILN